MVAQREVVSKPPAAIRDRWRQALQDKLDMRLSITTFLTLLTIISRGQEIRLGTFSRQNVAGDYSVATTITLKTDNRFTYEFWGHMIQEKADGSFQTNTDDRIIILTYDTVNQKDINYRNAVDMAPKKFIYKKDRLYEISDNGRPIKSRRLLSRHRRFYIFGDFSRRRKVFLERVSAEVPAANKMHNQWRGSV